MCNLQSRMIGSIQILAAIGLSVVSLARAQPQPSMARGDQFADPEPIVIGALVVFALSAAAAIFLVPELGQPFSGIMQISSVPLRSALAPL